ncbi:MAG: MerR family transcriptional regulator [Slackia sp.]|nr:MerR family transcriptional regulator [Slackia sp.]
MRSKELADLAGVTVRTLRHYHQMGLLAEPPRAENGYRTYGAADLARVLRIKRLASLGMSLRQVRSVLDAEFSESGAGADGARAGCTSVDALAVLDEELAVQIERLQEQRRIIADLRERAIDPDVPPAFGEHVARLRGAGASDVLVEYERSGLLLLDRFFKDGSQESEAVLQFLELVEQAHSVESYVALSERMLALSPDASERDCADLADDFVSFMTPVLKLGCKRFGWDLSAEAINELACSPDFSIPGGGGAEGSKGMRGCAETPRAVRGRTENPRAKTASDGEPGESLVSEDLQALDALLDLYDNETLNDAQRTMNERVVKGILAAFVNPCDRVENPIDPDVTS